MSWFASCFSHLPWAASQETAGYSAFSLSFRLTPWLSRYGAWCHMCHSCQSAQWCRVTENNIVVRVVYKPRFPPQPPPNSLWLLPMKTSGFKVTRLTVIHRKPLEGAKCTTHLKTTVPLQVSIPTEESMFQEHVSSSISEAEWTGPYSFYTSQKRPIVGRYPAQITQPVNKARNRMLVFDSWF